MNKKEAMKSGLAQAADLRSKAEDRLHTGEVCPAEAAAEADVRALVHELQVHQVELEMQNEELRRAHTQAAEASEKYHDLFDFAPVGCFLWDHKGLILEVNLAGAALLGLDRNLVVKKRFGQFVAMEHRVAFADFCKRVLATDAKQTCEVKLLHNEQLVDTLVEGIAARDDQGRRGMCRAAVIDISQQKRADGLAAANQTLEDEIVAGKQAEAEFLSLNETLERRVAERTAELAERAEQLRTLAAELTQTEQRERRRLAQVLHDDLQQMLVAARMKVGLLRQRNEEDQLGETIAQIDDLLNMSLSESCSLVAQLCPLVLYERGLGAALQWLARQTQEKFDLAVEIETDPAAEPADATTRVLLFQAVGELLLNAAKHAQAHRIWIRMDTTERHVRIEVHDDGVGFDPAQPADRTDGGGFGMFSIRTRLEVLNGHMEVVSSPGRGTQVTIHAPLGTAALPTDKT
jgi:PAS domain S-box-containing protein